MAKSLSDDVHILDRRYVVGYRGTDEFLERWEGTGLDTVPWKFTWTRERKLVRRFSYRALVTSGLMVLLVCGYGASVFMLRIK